MPVAQLTEHEKVKVRMHLGYLNVQQAYTFFLGVPAAIQTQFVIEGAFTRILPEAIGEVRDLVGRLDAYLDQMFDDKDLLAVEQIDEIKIRSDEFVQLFKQYDFWRCHLANIFGVTPNPYDQRFSGMIGGVNVAVQH